MSKKHLLYGYVIVHVEKKLSKQKRYLHTFQTLLPNTKKPTDTQAGV